MAGAFPDIPIIMDHSGYRYFQGEALEARKRHNNIHFGLSLVAEPGTSTGSRPRWTPTG